MESYELLDPQQLIQHAASELKGALAQVPKDQRVAVEEKIRRAEQMLEMARSKSAKELGYRLHDCKFPPALFIWSEQKQAHVCESCNQERHPPKPVRVIGKSNYVMGRRGPGDGTGWMGR
jgi:hypothetical protein